jgi:hypothetical protein
MHGLGLFPEGTEPPPDVNSFLFNQVSINQASDLSTVPEPATVTLLGAGLIALAKAGRRRRKH